MAAAAADPPAAGAEPDPAGADDAGADDPAAADEEDPLELQAAVPRARLTARPDTARRRCFISFLLDMGSLVGYGFSPTRGCGAVT